MSEIFIINEWIWADLNGDNGSEKQKEAFWFLCTLYEKCDKLGVAKGSPFQTKEGDFSKKTIGIQKREIARFYFGQIRFNSKKYKEVDIKEKEEIDLKGINRDDIYLMKTYEAIKAPVITTDNKLMEILESKGIPCKSRDAFLKEYLSNYF